MLFKFLLVALIALVGSVSCFPESRIVNGTDTNVRKYPFMVSLRDASGSHYCGGSIIDPRWILTAAHCVNGRSANQISVQYGTTVINGNRKNSVNVNRYVMHERFVYENKGFDIALLKLEHSLVYNKKTIAPVKLPKSFFEVPQTGAGAFGVLVGWGSNYTFGEAQSTLQEAKLKIYSDRDCNSKYSGATTTNDICAGVDEGGKDQCSGDSGGPLLYNGCVQVGIVSWSVKPCGMAIYPGVYTKVSHYINWIKKNMK